MMKFWLRMVPQLARLNTANRIRVIDHASKTSFSGTESIIMVVWLVFAYLLTKSILANSPGDSPVATAVATNLLITLPLVLVVVVPIYVRKVCREARKLMEAELGR